MSPFGYYEDCPANDFGSYNLGARSDYESCQQDFGEVSICYKGWDSCDQSPDSFVVGSESFQSDKDS